MKALVGSIEQTGSSIRRSPRPDDESVRVLQEGFRHDLVGFLHEGETLIRLARIALEEALIVQGRGQLDEVLEMRVSCL